MSADPLELVLARLQNVRPKMNGGYMASCPTAAHRRGDRRPSLAIDVGNHGGVIFRCFSQQCAVEDIAAALGLTVADLFPPRPIDPRYTGGLPKLPPIPWRDLFLGLELDLAAAELAFRDLLRGKPFSPEDARFLAERCDHLADSIRRARGVY